MSDYAEHLLAQLKKASEALDAACRLLDRRFGSRRWRADWTMGDTADEIRREAFGFGSFEEAEAEAEKRKADGCDWGVWYSPEGYPMVQIAD